VDKAAKEQLEAVLEDSDFEAVVISARVLRELMGDHREVAAMRQAFVDYVATREDPMSDEDALTVVAELTNTAAQMARS
jgi:hypothetical protein